MLMACYDCGEIFPEDKATIRKEVEIHNEVSPTAEEVKYDYSCPYCGSHDITDHVEECELCGEWAYQNYAETYLCNECVESIQKTVRKTIDSVLERKWKLSSLSRNDVGFILKEFIEWETM